MKREDNNMKSKKGFTLVEVMIIIAILGLIVAVAVPNIVEHRKKARAAKTIEEKDITLFAKVISVEGSTAASTCMAAVLQVEEKPDYILAVVDYESTAEITRAEAILESAISHDEIIERLAEIKGRYNEKGEFVIKSIKVGNLGVEF